MKKISALLLALLLAVTPSVNAWNSTGHMVIAAMAWQELVPGERAKVEAILEHHPAFADWKRAYSTGPKNVDFGAYVMMKAATWPDDIRGHRNPDDHPAWHYTNLPLIPPKFPEKPTLSGKEDVLWAIAHNQGILADRKASPERRAVALSWLIHLIGDLHQPLHAVAWAGPGYTKGDRGGNSFWIRPGRTGVSLHHFWDGLLGSSKNIRSAFNEATRLRTMLPPGTLPELAREKTPKAWASESRSIAIESVYLRGALRGGHDKQDAPPLPPGYTKEAKRVAERRASLAGARLATDLGSSIP